MILNHCVNNGEKKENMNSGTTIKTVGDLYKYLAKINKNKLIQIGYHDGCHCSCQDTCLCNLEAKKGISYISDSEKIVTLQAEY